MLCLRWLRAGDFDRWRRRWLPGQCKVRVHRARSIASIVLSVEKSRCGPRRDTMIKTMTPAAHSSVTTITMIQMVRSASPRFPPSSSARSASTAGATSMVPPPEAATVDGAAVVGSRSDTSHPNRRRCCLAPTQASSGTPQFGRSINVGATSSLTLSSHSDALRTSSRSDGTVAARSAPGRTTKTASTADVSLSLWFRLAPPDSTERPECTSTGNRIDCGVVALPVDPLST
mmetsp:Transcript_7874/g.25211  ORF Transcript_7874/g.25211 Transcript_7874/m.25211 type:complete len:231 (-) Transcript_7874:1163-1855(-)